MRHITLQLPTAVDDETVINILRATRQPISPSLDPSSQVSRVNNRCWRLLHHNKGLLGKFDDDDWLNQASSVELSQKPLENPTLVSNNTSNTLFSHMSNLSLHKNTFSSHSSMSHIDEEEASDGDSVTEPKKTDNKNIFFIANSPSPPKESQECGCDTTKKNDDVNIQTIDVIPNRPKILARQDSLFNNTNQIDIHKYSSSDMSDDGIEEEDEDTDSDSDSFSDIPSERRPADSTTEEKTSLNPIASKRKQSSASKNSRSDESEWLSISSEDEKAEVSYKPINFAKRIPPPVRQVSSDTITIKERPPTDNSPPIKPRSLLSGLFLNEMGRHHLQHKSPDEVSASNSSNGQSAESSGKSSVAPGNRKPILKRSSTTGIITVGQDADGNTNNNLKIQRPSIMFQKKFTSMTDISKKYPHFHNKKIKDDVLRENHNNKPESDSSSRCSHCDRPMENVPEIEIGEGKDGFGSLAKQKSIVGISDFNVVSDNNHKSETNGMNSSSNSNLNLNAFSQNSHSNTSSTTSSSVGNFNQSALSSSLNRYSTSSNTHSFKQVLSKSSLNLTNLFGSKKYAKYNASNEKFKKSNGSISSGHHSHSESNSTKSANIENPKELDSKDTSNTPELESSQSNHVAPTTIPGSVIPPVPTEIRNANHSGHSSIKRSVDSHGSGNHAANSQAPESAHQYDPDSSTTGIKMSPNSTRKNMFDSELSSSLKDSIRIDYTLGKVPLPHKIVSSTTTNFDPTEEEEFSVDDYHAKGW